MDEVILSMGREPPKWFLSSFLYSSTTLIQIVFKRIFLKDLRLKVVLGAILFNHDNDIYVREMRRCVICNGIPFII